MKYYIFQIVITFVICKLEVTERSQTDSLVSYLSKLKLNPMRTHETVGWCCLAFLCMVLLVFSYIYCGDYYVSDEVVRKLLLQNWTHGSVMINSSLKFPEENYKGVIETMFCFVESEDEMAPAVKYIIDYYFLRPDGNIRLVLTAQPKHGHWLRSTLEEIWGLTVLNYVVIYPHKGAYKMAGYNPFSKEVLFFGSTDEESLVFPDKMNDMYGYELTASMFEDYPRQQWINGELIGPDILLLKEICNDINISLKIIYSRDRRHNRKYLYDMTAEVSFVRVLRTSNPNSTINPTYPLSLDWMSCLVPLAEPELQYKKIFSVFQLNFWLTIVTSMLLVLTLNVIVAYKAQSSIPEACQSVFQIFLNVPYTAFLRKGQFQRIILMSWMLFSLLIAAAFNSKLRSKLINTSYNKQIKTVQDLHESGLPILLDESIAKLDYQWGLLGPQIVTFRGDITREILKFRKDRAIMHLYSFAFPFSLLKNRQRQFVYRTIDDHLGDGHSVYDFRLESPFKNKISDLTVLFREFGMGSFGLQLDAVQSKNSGDSVEVVLTLDHVQTSFYALILGCVFSATVFAGEVCCSIYERKLFYASLQKNFCK